MLFHKYACHCSATRITSDPLSHFLGIKRFVVTISTILGQVLGLLVILLKLCGKQAPDLALGSPGEVTHLAHKDLTTACLWSADI